MRRFRDPQGTQWDVVLGRESWGTSVALFVPPSSSDLEIRRATLDSSTHDGAMRELDSMDQAALQALFDRSSERQEGSG